MNIIAALTTAAHKVNTAAHKIVEPQVELPETIAFRELVAIDRHASREMESIDREASRELAALDYSARRPAPYETGRRFSARRYTAARSNIQAAMTSHHTVPVRNYDAEVQAYTAKYNH